MKWLDFSVTVGGLGRLPKAPGTWGTLGGIPLVFLFFQLGPTGYMAATMVFAILAIILCEWHERVSGQHDSKHVVIDEVAGFLVTMTWIPLTWQGFLAGFILFRIFDAIKPFPISVIDKKMKGGLGIVADDLLAGVISNIILQIVFTKTNWLGWQLV